MMSFTTELLQANIKKRLVLRSVNVLTHVYHFSGERKHYDLFGPVGWLLTPFNPQLFLTATFPTVELVLHDARKPDRDKRTFVSI
jgi:hypothetical protein